MIEMICLISAKEKEEEEEGTISRPSSPKEKEEGKGGAKPQPGEPTGLVREGSSHSVRIGERSCSQTVALASRYVKLCSVAISNYTCRISASHCHCRIEFLDRVKYLIGAIYM